MGLSINSKQETKRVYPLVAGVATLAPFAINPTREQLNSAGIPAENEPNYLMDYQGVKKRIVSIWFYGKNNVEQADGTVQAEIILAELKLYIPLQKKTTWIDKTGKYANDKNKLYDQASARLAYPQEWKLNDLLRCYGRAGYKDECSLDRIDDLILNGDTSELAAQFEACKKLGFKVRVLVGVVDSLYQVVNSRAFAMDNQISMKNFYEEVAKGVEFEKGFFGDFVDNSSVLTIQNATRLHKYDEQEALIWDDHKATRAREKSLTVTNMGQPQGYAPQAPAYGGGVAGQAPQAPAYNGGQPAAGAAPIQPTISAPDEFEPMGRKIGVAPATDPVLNRVPAGIEDDNDLPF